MFLGYGRVPSILILSKSILILVVLSDSVTKSERTVVIFENLPERLSKISERFMLNYRVVGTGQNV